MEQVLHDSTAQTGWTEDRRDEGYIDCLNLQPHC